MYDIRQFKPALYLLIIAGVTGFAMASQQSGLWTLAVGAIIFNAWLVKTDRFIPMPRILANVVVLVSMFLFYAYTSSFQLQNSAVKPGESSVGRATLFSGLIEFLGVWGLLFAAAAVALWPRPAADTEDARRRRDLFAASALAVSLLAGLASGRPAAFVVLPLAALAAAAGWRSLRAAEADGGGVFAAFLILLGLGMILGCEVVYLKDNYGADLQRMNTIFKFYHQAWPLLAIGIAVFAVRAWDRVRARWSPARLVLAAAGVVSLLWPINAAASRLRRC